MEVMVWKVKWQSVAGHQVVVSFVDAPASRVKKYTDQLDAEGVKYQVTKEEA